jgi:hypothetical protein
MNNEEQKFYYTQSLLTDLWKENPTFDYSTLDAFITNLLHNETYNCTIEQVSDFVKSLTRNLDVILMRKKDEITKPSTYIINGIELKKDYYSLRTEVGKILRLSASSINNKANEGIIKTLPGFKTKKVSAEEIYRFYCTYL